MTQPSSSEELDAILEELAMEESCDGDILSKYFERHPKYIQQITEFVHELMRPNVSEHMPLSRDDEDRLESRFTKFLEYLGSSSRPILGDLSVDKAKKLADKLGVKRQVITALRRRLVLVDTVSKKFLSSLAEALCCELKELKEELRMPPKMVGNFSHKSDSKPEVVEPISFEQTLKNAGYSKEDRARFMD